MQYSPKILNKNCNQHCSKQLLQKQKHAHRCRIIMENCPGKYKFQIDCLPPSGGAFETTRLKWGNCFGSFCSDRIPPRRLIPTAPSTYGARLRVCMEQHDHNKKKNGTKPKNGGIISPIDGIKIIPQLGSGWAM